MKNLELRNTLIPFLVTGFVLIASGCAPNHQREQEWVDLGQSSKPLEASSSREVNKKDIDLTPNHSKEVDYAHDSETFFQSYPKRPDTPPPIDQRQQAFDPDYDRPPHYGAKLLLPDVPIEIVKKPFPEDYVGVSRWNRKNAEPFGPLNAPMYTRYDANGKGILSSSPYYNRNTWYKKAGGVMGDTFATIGTSLFHEDEEISTVKFGPTGSFATNFMENLRGGSVSFGASLVGIQNRWTGFEGWLGYRRVLFGITGESKEVYTLDNAAIGLYYAFLPYIAPEQHLRTSLGVEFDYNVSTETATAGTTPRYTDGINFYALSLALSWDQDAWSVFGRYLFVPRALTEDYNSYLHVAELGISFYIF